MEDIGFDFEEGFSDDEDINFGIEDKDEHKEAIKRLQGRSGDIDGGLDDIWNNAETKVSNPLTPATRKEFGET